MLTWFEIKSLVITINNIVYGYIVFAYLSSLSFLVRIISTGFVSATSCLDLSAFVCFVYLDCLFCFPLSAVRNGPWYSQGFKECGQGLRFTFELPRGVVLQFLDVRLGFREGHVCYEYNPRPGRALLHFESPHSKGLKQGIGIALSCLKSAITKPHEHSIATSVLEQVKKVRKSA